jgi:hypothetical protein
MSYVKNRSTTTGRAGVISLRKIFAESKDFGVKRLKVGMRIAHLLRPPLTGWPDLKQPPV